MANLFSGLKIKNLELRNRIVCPPMAMRLADKNGYVTEKIVEHYLARADAGLIIVESSYVSRAGRLTDMHLGIHDDNCLPGFTRLVEVIHEAGTKCGIQLSHSGSSCREEIIGEQPIAPSAVSHLKDGGMPREITHSEMKRLIGEYVLAARRAKQAGFDMVEIHGAHGYLLNQFLSPYTNHRKDEYGGSIENRLRFPLEIYRAVRAEVGIDYPIFYRLGADDGLDGGITPEEGAQAAVLLAEAGVDVLDLSGGLTGARAKSGEGYNNYLAEKIKPHVAVPILITGGITFSRTAEKILNEGKADLIGVGRALLANPNWVREADQGVI